MEKIQGIKNFGNEGEGRFREILCCPPPKMRVAPQMLPQIPRPGAATVEKDWGEKVLNVNKCFVYIWDLNVL